MAEVWAENIVKASLCKKWNLNIQRIAPFSRTTNVSALIANLFYTYIQLYSLLLKAARWVQISLTTT